MPEIVAFSGVRSNRVVGYLKALGLLSIVSRQLDPDVRGAWNGRVFELHGNFGRVAIERFLLKQFVPAPVMSPWNGGSGFFPGDKAARAAFDAIEGADDDRFDRFRIGLAACRSALADSGLHKKPESKRDKQRLLRHLRATLPDDALEWLDAAVILLEDSVVYSPVLGSGGNDGRFDIAGNYAQAVVSTLIDDKADHGLLDASLWGDPARLEQGSLGHLQRDASPNNSPAGESDALGSPWDLILSVHGALLLKASVSRRTDTSAARAVAPFTVRPTGTGYGSAVAGEKGRAELWLPIWSSAANLREIVRLIRDARAEVAGRQATTAREMYRASASSGVPAGIDAFERFAIVERSGKSNLTVHAGRVLVRASLAEQAVHTLDRWLTRVLRHADDHAPKAQREVIRQLDGAIVALLQHPTAEAAARVLCAVGEVEQSFVFAAPGDRPPGLRPPVADAGPWFELLGDPGWTPEYRIAIGFASLRDRLPAGQLSSFRQYLHGVERRGCGLHYCEGEIRPVLRNADIDSRLAQIAVRRSRDADLDGRPMAFEQGVPLSTSDIALFTSAARSLDRRLINSLIDGMVVLRFDRDSKASLAATGSPVAVDPLAHLLSFAAHDSLSRSTAWREYGHEGTSQAQPGWAPALTSGAIAPVVDDALLRLRLAGYTPIVETGDFVTGRDPERGRRLAAALLIRPRLADINDARERFVVPPHRDRPQPTSQI